MLFTLIIIFMYMLFYLEWFYIYVCLYFFFACFEKLHFIICVQFNPSDNCIMLVTLISILIYMLFSVNILFVCFCFIFTLIGFEKLHFVIFIHFHHAVMLVVVFITIMQSYSNHSVVV